MVDINVQDDEEDMSAILKDLVHAVDALNLKYIGTKENNALNALQKAKNFLKE